MRKRIAVISLCLILVVAFTNACTPKEMEQLEGILQNVDVANGEITIVTKDGQTKTFSIDTEASVEAEEVLSTLETLEVGDSIQIEVNEDNQVVQSVEAQQTEVEVDDEENNKEDTIEVTLSSDDVKEEDEAIEDEVIDDEQPVSSDVEDIPGDSSDTQDDPDDGDVKPDVEPSVDIPEDSSDTQDDPDDGDVKPDVEPSVDIPSVAEYVADSIIGLEELKARTEQGIAENRISGIYDAEWMKNAQAEVDRLAEMIGDLQTPGKYTEEYYNIVIINGVLILQEDNDARPTLEVPGEDELPDDGDDHPDDGDDHPDDGDDHPDDGDDHPDDDDDHPDDDH